MKLNQKAITRQNTLLGDEGDVDNVGNIGVGNVGVVGLYSPVGIKNWEDVVNDITTKWEADSLDEYNYIDHSKKNPHNNGKSEFEDGTGDTNFETTKIEIYDDIKWKNLIEIKKL